MSSKYTWNHQHLIRDGKPWLPTMGEIHYSRYPREKWRDSLRRMKACGVEIVATYVFWIHHEEQEGCFDFTGRRDVGAFLRLCKEEGLDVWFRIGPWCHGECRHGGFPEWLMAKDIPTRTNHPEYLRCVKRFWSALFAQADGLFLDQSGPIIGIQIENEFGHAGGDGDPNHMRSLKEMAIELGFRAPYYSATGWGGAVIGDMLPVMGCYCDAPWDRRLAPLPPSPNYLFSLERNDVDVGSDFRRGEHLTFSSDDYPWLLAEMGGGINSTFHRRPVAVSADTGAMALTKIGSGANLVGYYMFHGGVNPGEHLNETRASGSWCEVPHMQYFPDAPISDLGVITPLGREAKLLAMFTRDFGEYLAPMVPVIPQDNAARPGDTEHLRYCRRMKDGRGFLFLNNHQRGMNLPARQADIDGFGLVDLPADAYAAWPINLPVGHATIRSAHAMPLCILNGDTWVFHADGDPQYVIEGDLGENRIITLTRQEALNAWRIARGGRETLILCDAPVIQSPEGIFIHTCENAAWSDLITGESGLAQIPAGESRVEIIPGRCNYQCEEFTLQIGYADCAETFLRIDYEGSIAEILVDGVKVADDMYDGNPWEVEISRFGNPETIELRIFALFEGMPVWLEHPPTYVDGRALKLHHVQIKNEYILSM